MNPRTPASCSRLMCQREGGAARRGRRAREEDGDGRKEPMGNDEGVRIFAHKRAQFANC